MYVFQVGNQQSSGNLQFFAMVTSGSQFGNRKFQGLETEAPCHLKSFLFVVYAGVIFGAVPAVHGFSRLVPDGFPTGARFLKSRANLKCQNFSRIWLQKPLFQVVSPLKHYRL